MSNRVSSPLLVVTVAVFVFLLAACVPDAPHKDTDDAAQPAATQAPQRGGTVVLGTVTDMESWNPYLVEGSLAANVLAHIYPSLVVEQPDFYDHPPTFAPSLAASWEWSQDHLVLTMHLRDDAVWSDGVPITSEDVLFTWQVQSSPELGWTDAYLKESIDRVEAPDEHTVRFVFNRRYPYQLMDANEGLIVPAHAWREIPFATWRETDWTDRVVAGGPFRLAGHVPLQEFTLERNQRYWKPDRPLLDRAIWRVVQSQVSLLTQLRTGDLDFVYMVPAHQAESVRAQQGLELVLEPEARYTYIGWNNRHPLFSDARVRRAMTLAIDRQEILDAAVAGFGRLAAGPILSSMWAFNSSLEPLPHDPARAGELLAEAGWSDSDGDGVLDRNGMPFTFELLTNAGVQEREDICVIVEQQLERIGVKVERRYQEWGTVIERMYGGDFDAVVSNWMEPTKIDLADVWHSAAADEETSNFIGYSNSEVDALIERAEGMSEFAEQKPLYDRVQELIVEDQPYTFLYERFTRTGISSSLGGVEVNELSPYFNLEEWYVRSPRSE